MPSDFFKESRHQNKDVAIASKGLQNLDLLLGAYGL